MSIAIGAAAPGFSLPDTEGAEHAPDGAPATVGCSIKWRAG
jgi:hypothetical protein